MPPLVRKPRDRRGAKRRLQDMSKTSKRRVSPGGKTARDKKMMREWRSNPDALDVEGVDDLKAGRRLLKGLHSRSRGKKRARKCRTASRRMSAGASSSSRADRLAKKLGWSSHQQVMRARGWDDKRIAAVTPAQMRAFVKGMEKDVKNLGEERAEDRRRARMSSEVKRKVSTPAAIDEYLAKRGKGGKSEVFEDEYRAARAGGSPHVKAEQRAKGAARLAKERARKAG